MDMVQSVGAALITNLTASMDPSRKVIIEQIQAMGQRAKLDNENYKDVMLNDLYTRIREEKAQPKPSTALLNSLERRIKRIEEL